MFGLVGVSQAANHEFSEISPAEFVQIDRSDPTKSVYTLSEENYDLLKDSTLQGVPPDANINNTLLLKAIGFSENGILTMGESEMERLLSDTDSIVASVSYLKTDAQGNTSYISESEVIRDLIILASENPYSLKQEIVGNGYLRITTAAFYKDPASQGGQKGWYEISAEYKWLIMPIARLKDAVSLYATHCATSSYNNDFFSNMRYDEVYLNSYGQEMSRNYVVSEKTSTDLSRHTDGFFYTWNLPNNYGLSKIIENLTLYLRGKVRVSDYTNSRAFNVYSKYVHTSASVIVEPSFSWDPTNGLGVSLNVNLLLKSDNYHSMIYVDYNTP